MCRIGLAVALASLLPLPATAQVAPRGWAELLGKNCVIRNEVSGRNSVVAVFKQTNDGAEVELKFGNRGTRTNKVAFAPPRRDDL